MIDEKSFLRWVIASDRSPRYDYREPRPDGAIPKEGGRWLTPKELAEARLKEIVAREIMEGSDGIVD